MPRRLMQGEVVSDKGDKTVVVWSSARFSILDEEDRAPLQALSGP